MNNKLSNIQFPDLKSVDEFLEFKTKSIDTVMLALNQIIKRHNLPNAALTTLEGTNIVYAYGEARIIKIYPSVLKDNYVSESLVLKALKGKLNIKTPVLEFEGEIAGWPYVIISKLEGTLLEGLWETFEHSNKLALIKELGAAIRKVHSLPTHGLEAIDCNWHQFINQQINNCVSHHRSKNLPDYLIQQIPAFLNPVIEALQKIDKPVLLTGEYTPMNLLVKQTPDNWQLTGLIDFGDCILGLNDYDLLGPICFLVQGDKILLTEFLKSYGFPLDTFSAEELKFLKRKLIVLILLHRYSNLDIIIRIEGWKNKVKTLEDLENLVLPM